MYPLALREYPITKQKPCQRVKVRDVTPSAGTGRHGYHITDGQRIGNTVYRWFYVLVISNGHAERVNYDCRMEVIPPPKPYQPVISRRRAYEPYYVPPKNPYENDPFWNHFDLLFELWRESQRERKI